MRGFRPEQVVVVLDDIGPILERSWPKTGDLAVVKSLRGCNRDVIHCDEPGLLRTCEGQMVEIHGIHSFL